MDVARTPRNALVESPSLGGADARALDRLDGVVAVHPHLVHWWNNASFALPFLAAVVSLAVGLAGGVAEATGFGLFMLAVTAITAPIVAITWRRTPTALVLTGEMLVALHSGRELRRLRWEEIESVRAVDYDDVRWRLYPRAGEHLALESGIERLPELIDEVCGRSGLERPPHEREQRLPGGGGGPGGPAPGP
ncbi:MAG: hypothetical protein OXC94_11480 [Chloroflexi bacterium]|nr:hypothetical protein [Chloroflexota bacterium]